MKRVLVIGRGASGKSTLARRLSELSQLPVIELDKIFWQPGLVATPREQWIVIQETLAAEPEWIMDGDLGPYDAIEARLHRADTIIFLDFSLVCCVWRAIRRSRERLDFWNWVFSYRRKHRPELLATISQHAPNANPLIFSSPGNLEQFLDGMTPTDSSNKQRYANDSKRTLS
jgi:adenylate kinase family enzyme